jgi:hypothetical protein
VWRSNPYPGTLAPQNPEILALKALNYVVADIAKGTVLVIWRENSPNWFAFR